MDFVRWSVASQNLDASIGNCLQFLQRDVVHKKTENLRKVLPATDLHPAPRATKPRCDMLDDTIIR